MRIRKLATQILGAAPIPFEWIHPGGAAGCSSAPPPEGFCQTNRSPWDVLDSPELRRHRHLPELPKLEVEEDESFLLQGRRGGGGGRETAIVVQPSAMDRKVKREPLRYSEASEAVAEEKSRQRRRPRSKKKPKPPPPKSRIGAGDTSDASSDAVVPPPPLLRCRKSCKKSGGSEWRCRNRAKLPHTLCDYHLSQTRSYCRTLTPAKRVAAVDDDDAAFDRRRDTRRRRPTPAVSDFYYYSGFGPWRGKSRSCRIDINGGEDDNLEEPGGSGSSEEEGGGARSVFMEENMKKRGRKRIKARSLKSLL